MTECIFCNIVKGDAPCHKVWENEKYLAFLSIFPNTEGVTVVIPKKHHSSYFFDLPEEVFNGLVNATRAVAKKLDATFDDVGRTGMVAEGFGVDHVHLKLFPMHGTAGDVWEQRASAINYYYKNYPGYISSHDADRADEDTLRAVAARIIDAGAT
ncbi:MAG: HIT family protein [Gallionellaceae bacterium]